MRRFMDIVNEKVFYKMPTNTGDELTILENPSRREMMRQVTDKNNGWFRGFLTDDGNVFIFDAFLGTHWDVGPKVGISGKPFEIRGDSKRGLVSTYLYLQQNEAINNKDKWLDNPNIMRLFKDVPAEEFHLGKLRW